MRKEGLDLVEYALVLALIALAAVAGINTLAGALSTVLASIATALVSAG